MDINRIIELLKQALAETEELRARGIRKEEFDLWHDKVLDTLEAGFGRKSTEFDRFASASRTSIAFYTEEQRKKEYDRRLILYETALKSVIQKYEMLGFEAESTPMAELKDKDELPVDLFDKMQFHPKVIEASRELFKDGYYRDAILRAFISVNNFVKEKTGLELDGKALMAQVFKKEHPVIKLNELRNKSEEDEQEGFMFLFMGAMVGIRNPKAHDNVIQTDPSRTLEYLALASILMKRVEEGILVKTSPPRKQWNLQRFLIDASEKCSKEVVDTISKLYDFTKKYSDSISWGTGAHWGSFTFRKSWHGIKASIFTVCSDSSLSINFGQMLGSGIEEEALESLRIELNRIPDIKISKDAVPNGKYPDISVDPFVNIYHLNKFQEVILSFYLKLESNKEKS